MSAILYSLSANIQDSGMKYDIFTEAISGILAYFCGISCYMALPLLYLVLILIKNFEKQNLFVQTIIGKELLKNIRHYNRAAIAYNLVYFVRRILICLVSVYLREYPS